MSNQFHVYSDLLLDSMSIGLPSLNKRFCKKVVKWPENFQANPKKSILRVSNREPNRGSSMMSLLNLDFSSMSL